MRSSHRWCERCHARIAHSRNRHTMCETCLRAHRAKLQAARKKKPRPGE